jgi:hypothetical protein
MNDIVSDTGVAITASFHFISKTEQSERKLTEKGPSPKGKFAMLTVNGSTLTSKHRRRRRRRCCRHLPPTNFMSMVRRRRLRRGETDEATAAPTKQA